MPNRSIYRALLLALLISSMAITRLHQSPVIPDASWAVFFVAGFYFARQALWVFPTLLITAVLVDASVISNMGLDFWGHYCISPAYALLAPSYFLLWSGGTWVARAGNQPAVLLKRLAIALPIAISLCFLLSNGSFYWLSDAWLTPNHQRSFVGWMANMGHWHFIYLLVTVCYVGMAAATHGLWLAHILKKSSTSSSYIH